MQNAITLSINGYRHFVEEFRRNCTQGAGKFDVSSRFNGKTRGFRFRRKDEYLVAIDNLGTGRFKPLQEKPVDQGHYQNMTPVKALTRSSVGNCVLAELRRRVQRMERQPARGGVPDRRGGAVGGDLPRGAGRAARQDDRV